MCQLKVSAPTGRSESGFDVCYGHKQSQEVSMLCVYFCVLVFVCNKECLCLIFLLYKGVFVCIFVFLYIKERALKALPNQ